MKMKKKVDHLKKYKTGDATKYITRTRAIKKLQITLKDFRRICILKGIYPVEPKHPKKVNKGKGSIRRTYYLSKDISFLGRDSVLKHFAEYKIYLRRLKKARGRRDREKEAIVRINKPSYELTHIIRERYPHLNDALQDLGDCLTLMFLFSTFGQSQSLKYDKIQFCRRLTMEFAHYCIHMQSLKKCFISIKGFYYQVEINGITVNWIMPHRFRHLAGSDVDITIMEVFLELYISLLAFVNMKLYADANLVYPPKFVEIIDQDQKLFSINEMNNELVQMLSLTPLRNEVVVKDVETEQEEKELIEERNDLLISSGLSEEEIEKMEKNRKDKETLSTLFAGLTFYLNREVPIEQFVIPLRCCGAKVAWEAADMDLGKVSRYSSKKCIELCGSLNHEDLWLKSMDNRITHHVLERAIPKDLPVSRSYVAPQWIFDCINQRKLLPCEDYQPGKMLPPHVSPFVELDDNETTVYNPNDPQLTEEDMERANIHDSDEESDMEIDDSEDDNNDEEEEDEDVNALPPKQFNSLPIQEKVKVIQITKGKSIPKQLKEDTARAEEKSILRLKEKGVKNKYRKIYHKMKEEEMNQNKRMTRLKTKRAKLENQKQKSK
ncbi:hypothetical protein SNEBB_006859 [Seison nebaliae]|nr:hypothetical protein SNEBB_006859 [Seison nebaliae]